MSGNELGLLAVYYNQIGPLPMSSFTHDGDVQSRATYLFPHRDSQFAEAMGRDPLTLAGEFLFINGINGDNDLYPKRYIQMKQAVRSKELGILTDPVWGAVKGFFLPFTSHFGMDVVNGCKVAFTFHEVGSTAFNSALTDPMPVAQEHAAIADAGLTALRASPTTALSIPGFPVPPPLPAGLPPLPVLPLPGFPYPGLLPGSLSDDVAAMTELFADDNSLADQINGMASLFRSKVEMMLLYPVLQDAGNADVYNALTVTLAAVSEAAALAASRAPGLIEFVLPGDMGPLILAHYLYGDSSRAGELVRLNPPRDFYWPKATRLFVPV